MALLLQTFLDVLAVFSVIDCAEIAFLSLWVHVALELPNFILGKQLDEQGSPFSSKVQHALVIFFKGLPLEGINRATAIVAQEGRRSPLPDAPGVVDGHVYVFGDFHA